MEVGFYTPTYGVKEGCFGCATFGYVGQWDPMVPSFISLTEQLKGDMVCGSYECCLDNIPNKKYQAAIVLLGNAGDENAFVHQLAEKIHAPVVGGGAAIHPETGKTAMITGRQQAAVYLICDDRYHLEVCCENIHHDILSQHTIGFSDPRQMDTIDGIDAAAWLAQKKASMGLSGADFEHLTFSDTNGINAHLSLVDGKIRSGRDLTENMLLRYVPADCVYERMQKFYNDPNAVVFGCAGLKGILPQPLQTEGVGLFLFGEVCTKDGISEFGNLMLSKLRILPK